MIRFIIQNKETGKYLKRVQGFSRKQNTWVSSVDDATLITTASAASQIATRFCGARKYRKRAYYLNSLPVKVIEVGILIYPVGVQPFIDGVLNGNN